ncbi:MAG: hypothetical protein ACFFAO_04820 [Candidatus Hermodarchaeota archaeon]
MEEWKKFLIGLICALIVFVPIIIIIAINAGAIGESAQQHWREWWETTFGDVEVPGFEPILLIGVFSFLAVLVIYNYHLKFKKINN